MSGRNFNSEAINAIDDQELQDFYKVPVEIDHIDAEVGSKKVNAAMEELSNSKWDYHASAIRYIKKGMKAKTKTWPNKLKKVNQLRKQIKSLELLVGEEISIRRFDRSQPILDKEQKSGSLFYIRLNELINGKSKTRSCQHCNHVTKTIDLCVFSVAVCEKCRGDLPFKSVSFEKKLASTRNKLVKAQKELSELIGKLSKINPYLYDVDYSCCDDDVDDYVEENLSPYS